MLDALLCAIVDHEFIDSTIPAARFAASANGELLPLILLIAFKKLFWYEVLPHTILRCGSFASFPYDQLSLGVSAVVKRIVLCLSCGNPPQRNVETLILHLPG